MAEEFTDLEVVNGDMPEWQGYSVNRNLAYKFVAFARCKLACLDSGARM